MNPAERERIEAEQAQAVDKRIRAIEVFGQHGEMPDYWRGALALAFAADEIGAADLSAALAAAEHALAQATRENERLRGALEEIASSHYAGVYWDGESTAPDVAAEYKRRAKDALASRPGEGAA